MKTMWLAADYHMPTTYSCRIPMSSMSSALALPAPGPATVRLALLRTGIEYLGWDIVRERIFPTLRAVPLALRPPERLALSKHLLHAYKWEQSRSGLGESIAVREIVHAEGPMTIYLEIPTDQETWYRTLLQAIGYWGQTDSLTCCTAITSHSPKLTECAQSLHERGTHHRLQGFLGTVLSEFRAPTVTWQEIMLAWESSSSSLRLDIYIWPLVTQQISGAGRLLIRQPFPE